MGIAVGASMTGWNDRIRIAQKQSQRDRLAEKAAASPAPFVVVAICYSVCVFSRLARFDLMSGTCR